MRQKIEQNRTRSSRTAALLGLVVALTVLVAPSTALASKSQWSMFEDHVLLVRSGPVARENTLTEMRNLGADTLRIEVKWSEVAPNPAAKSQPAFDATDPSAYPGPPHAAPSRMGFPQLHVRRGAHNADDLA